MPSFVSPARKKNKSTSYFFTNGQWWKYCSGLSDKEKRSFQVPHMYCSVVHCVLVVISTYSSTHIVVCWLPGNHFSIQSLVFADK